MRRLFVIFLALLFPLNVYTLSMSVATMPSTTIQQDVPEHTLAQVLVVADAAVDDTGFDIDPDEQRASMDIYDTMSAPARLLLITQPDRSLCSTPLDEWGLDPRPPIKPPPLAGTRAGQPA